MKTKIVDLRDTVEQWIKDHDLESVLYVNIGSYNIKYGNFVIFHVQPLTFITALYVDNRAPQLRYLEWRTIEEILFAIDDAGVFKNDLKWKVMITMLKERNK